MPQHRPQSPPQTPPEDPTDILGAMLKLITGSKTIQEDLARAAYSRITPWSPLVPDQIITNIWRDAKKGRTEGVHKRRVAGLDDEMAWALYLGLPTPSLTKFLTPTNVGERRYALSQELEDELIKIVSRAHLQPTTEDEALLAGKPVVINGDQLHSALSMLGRFTIDLDKSPTGTVLKYSDVWDLNRDSAASIAGAFGVGKPFSVSGSIPIDVTTSGGYEEFSRRKATRLLTPSVDPTQTPAPQDVTRVEPSKAPVEDPTGILDAILGIWRGLGLGIKTPPESLPKPVQKVLGAAGRGAKWAQTNLDPLSMIMGGVGPGGARKLAEIMEGVKKQGANRIVDLASRSWDDFSKTIDDADFGELLDFTRLVDDETDKAVQSMMKSIDTPLEQGEPMANMWSIANERVQSRIKAEITKRQMLGTVPADWGFYTPQEVMPFLGRYFNRAMSDAEMFGFQLEHMLKGGGR